MTWAKRVAWFVLIAAVAVPLHAQRRSRRTLPQHYRFLKEKQDLPEGARAVLRNGFTFLVEERAGPPVTAVVSLVALDTSLGAAGRERAMALAGRVAALGEIESRTLNSGGLFTLREDRAGIAFTTLVPAENLDRVLEVHRDLLMLDPSRLEDDADRYRRTFRAGNVVLSVSGTALRENLLERVVELYGRLKNSGARLRIKPVAAQPGKQFVYRQRREGNRPPRVIFEFEVPEFPLADSYPLEVLRTAMTEGWDSLSRRLLIAQDAVVAAESRLRPGPDGVRLEVAVTPRPGKLDAAEVGLLAQLEILRTRLLDHRELNRAKALLLSRYYQQRESLDQRAILRSRGEALGTGFALNPPPDLLLAVDPEAVRRVARRYLTMGNLTLTEELPESFEERNFTAETLAETLQLLAPIQVEEMWARLDALRPPQDIAPLKPVFEPKLTASSLKRTSVLRGPDIYLQEEHRLPLVHLGLVLPGGRIDEPASRRGITELMLRSLASSADATQPAGFWRDLESAGCHTRIINQEDLFGFGFSCLSIDTAEVLGRLMPWWRNPVLDPEAVQREQRRLLAEIAALPANLPERLEYQVRGLLFGDHPYGSPPWGSARTVSGLEAEAVGEWADRTIKGFHPVLLILGDVQGTSFLAPLIGMLSDSKLTVKKMPEKEATEQASVGEIESAQLRLLGVPGPVQGVRDAWLLRVLERRLQFLEGTIPASGDLPAVSGVRLSHQAFVNGGVVLVRQEMGIGSSEGVRRALRRLSSVPVKERDHFNSLVVAITAFYSQRQNGSQRLVDLAKNLLAGEQPEYEQELLTTLKGVQRQEMRGLAERLFGRIPVQSEAQSGEVSP